MEIPQMTSTDMITFLSDCEQKLIVKGPMEIIYPDDVLTDDNLVWTSHVEGMKSMNKSLLDSIGGQANVYAIYQRVSKEEPWTIVYVGQRKASYMRSRIVSHLFNKHHKTGSKLDNVKEAIQSNQSIAVSFLKVAPDSFRLIVEDFIIENNKGRLPWNIHGNR